MIIKYGFDIARNCAPSSLPHTLLRLNHLLVTFPSSFRASLGCMFYPHFFYKKCHRGVGEMGTIPCDLSWIFNIENENHYSGVSNIWDSFYTKLYS